MHLKEKGHRLMKLQEALILVAIALFCTGGVTRAEETGFSGMDGTRILPETGELRLEADPGEMVFAFDATEWRNVTSMAVYRDKLYLGACDQVSVHDSGDVAVYNEDTASVEKIFSVQEQGLAEVYAFGAKLYVPGTDSTTDANTGNIYIFDGEIWVKKSTITGGKVAHVWDMGMMGGKLYVSTNNRENKAILWESADDGDTWKVVYEYKLVAGTAIYMQDIAVYKGKLYTWIMHNYHGAVDIGLVEFDGKEGKPIYPFGEDNYVSWVTFGHVKDDLYVCGRFGPFYVPKEEKSLLLSVSPQFKKRKIGKNPPVHGCCAFNGENCEQVSFFDGVQVRAIGEFIGAPVVIFENPTGGKSRLATYDGEEWREISSIPEGNSGESIAEYHGRLFVGTEGAGNIYVSAYRRSGSATTKPLEVKPGEKKNISINEEVPEKTSLEIQVRAGTVEGIDNTPFENYEYTGSGKLIYQNKSGEPLLVQWKITMKTEDPLVTPRVKMAEK